MKKSIITIVLVLVSNAFFAQTTLDKYNGQENVASIVVNKKMFQMMSSVKTGAKDKETQQYLDLIKKLDELKVFSTTNAKITADMRLTVDKYWKPAGLTQLTQADDNGKTLKIWTKPSATNGQIKELLMFNEDANKENPTVLISLTGDFSLNEISVLIDKMKIPGGADLKKATVGK